MEMINTNTGPFSHFCTESGIAQCARHFDKQAERPAGALVMQAACTDWKKEKHIKQCSRLIVSHHVEERNVHMTLSDHCLSVLWQAFYKSKKARLPGTLMKLIVTWLIGEMLVGMDREDDLPTWLEATHNSVHVQCNFRELPCPEINKCKDSFERTGLK